MGTGCGHIMLMFFSVFADKAALKLPCCLRLLTFPSTYNLFYILPLHHTNNANTTLFKVSIVTQRFYSGHPQGMENKNK